MTFCKHPSLLAATCLLFSHAAPADIIVLKGGEKLDGQILREVDGKYVVEVRVSASIKDEKIIPRADVVRIEKEAEDEKAFRGIADLVPAPDLLSLEKYVTRIEKLEAFLKDYPDSIRAKRVKEMLETLGVEHDLVVAGGFKLGGEPVTGEEYIADALAHDSRIAEKKIEDAVARGDYLPALRMYDEYEVTFGDTERRAGLGALMLQVMGAYRSKVTESLASLESRLKAREEGLKRMSPEDRLNSERAIREETESLKKRFADEKAARVKWITPDAFHKESMDETLRLITLETTRLERTVAAPGAPLAEIYRDSWEKLAGGTDAEKKAVIDAAKAKRLPEAYIAKLLERAALPEE